MIVRRCFIHLLLRHCCCLLVLLRLNQVISIIASRVGAEANSADPSHFPFEAKVLIRWRLFYNDLLMMLQVLRVPLLVIQLYLAQSKLRHCQLISVRIRILSSGQC